MLTASCPLDDPVRVPPVIVPAAVPVGVTKIPPLLIVLSPVSVNVYAVALLKRRLFGVIAAVGVWLESTSMLAAA